MNWGDPHAGQTRRVSVFTVAALSFALAAALVSVGLCATPHLRVWNAAFAMAAPLVFGSALGFGSVAAWQCRESPGLRGLRAALFALLLGYVSLAVWALLISDLLLGADGQRLAVTMLAIVGVALLIVNACEAMKYLVIVVLALTMTLSLVSLRVYESKVQAYSTLAKNNLRGLGFNIAQFREAHNQLPSSSRRFMPPRR